MEVLSSLMTMVGLGATFTLASFPRSAHNKRLNSGGTADLPTLHNIHIAPSAPLCSDVHQEHASHKTADGVLIGWHDNA